MRAVIYCRVSSKRQVDNTSLTTQRRLCREYCEARGIVVDRVFMEMGESAKSADRPELQNMLRHCEQHGERVDLALVYSFKRFARIARDHLDAKLRLNLAGVELRSITEATDDTPVGHFAELMLAGIAQLDNETKAVRTVEGMKEALRRGRWTHQAPVGYLTAPKESRSPCLLPDAERASGVVLAFELCATGGYSKAKLLRQVTAAGLRSRRGNALTPQTLDRMLRNPLYCGWMVSKLGEKQRGDFEPLVSEETFYKVQAILDGKRISVKHHTLDQPFFPLRRFVRCSECGTPLTGAVTRSREREYPYYWCRRKGCRAVKSTPTDRLHGLFRDLLGQHAVSPQLVLLFKEVVRDVWRERKLVEEAHGRELESRLDELRRRESLLFEACFYERALDRGTYAVQQDRLAREIAEAEMALQNAAKSFGLEAVLEFAEGVLVAPERLWIDAPAEARIRLQRVVFPEGLSYDGRGFRNAATSPVLRVLQVAASQDVELASPTGFELPPHGGRVSDS